MRKLSPKQRLIDVKRHINERKKVLSTKVSKKVNNDQNHQIAMWHDVNEWVNAEVERGLRISSIIDGKKLPKNNIVLHLPKRMDFYENQDATVQCLSAIRKLVSVYEHYKSKQISNKAFKLKSVNFDELASISTSAALVLTAEVSRWDISITRRLKPQVERWHKNIYLQLEQLGFFDFFSLSKRPSIESERSSPDVNFVRYIRGKCGDSDDAKAKKKELKEQIANLVGAKIDKWTMLHSGLTEAVTNVTHHAYPDKRTCEEMSWYLTGSYNQSTTEMKIAFYDQGVGIPNSLPASEIWEKVLSYFAKLNISGAEQKKHAKLLEAAVSIDRTSTDQNDRGKGLQDLLEFIRERGEGYLSILSYHGLYKCWIEKGKEKSKAIAMDRPLNGTLIIWSVKLS